MLSKALGLARKNPGGFLSKSVSVFKCFRPFQWGPLFALILVFFYQKACVYSVPFPPSVDVFHSLSLKIYSLYCEWWLHMFLNLNSVTLRHTAARCSVQLGWQTMCLFTARLTNCLLPLAVPHLSQPLIMSLPQLGCWLTRVCQVSLLFVTQKQLNISGCSWKNKQFGFSGQG